MQMNQAQDNMQKLIDLFAIAEETGVSETDWFTQEFEMLCARFDSFRFQKLMQRVLSSNSIPSLLNQVFRNPRTEEEIHAIQGDYQFGTIVNTDYEAGLGEKAAGQHTVIAGASGHGKTTLLNTLLESILKKNRIKIWAIDPKTQMADFRHLTGKYSNTILIPLSKLRLNPFGPIMGVPRQALIERAIEVLSDCWSVYDASQGVIAEHTEKVFQRVELPCFQDIASSILSEKSQRYGRRQSYLDTLEVRIKSTMLSLRNVFACRLDYFDSLYDNYNVIFEVGGISDQALKVIVPFIIMKLSLYKTYNPSKKLSHLLFFEEAQAAIFSKLLEQRSRIPTVANLATQARSYGLGLGILAQNPATKIITEMLSNSSSLICFHVGGTEVRGMSECMGLNFEQAAMLQHLQPGFCIYKTSLGYTEPVLVQVKNVDNTPPSNSEVERLMQPVWYELLAKVVPMEQKEEPIVAPTHSVAENTTKNNTGNTLAKNPTDLELQPDDKIFLQDVQLRQYEYTEDRYDQCSMSRSRAVKAKSRLIRLGYLEEVTIRSGKRGSQPTILRLTEKAADSLGIHADKGKGSLLHTWYQQFVLFLAKRIPGVKARIEDMSADISLSNGSGNDVAIEITLHDSNIQRNIERNFSKGFKEVWLAVKDTAMQEKVKSALATRILQQGTVGVILLEELALEIRKRFSDGHA